MTILFVVILIIFGLLIALWPGINRDRLKVGSGEDISDCVRVLYERLRAKMIKGQEGNEGKTIIQLHYAAWCPYCIKFLSPWNQAKYDLIDDKDIIMLEHNEDVCRTVGIKTVPAVFKLKGDRLCKFEGARDVESLKKWIKE